MFSQYSRILADRINLQPAIADFHLDDPSELRILLYHMIALKMMSHHYYYYLFTHYTAAVACCYGYKGQKTITKIMLTCAACWRSG